jgi:4-amino-4-deoxy-L-arabinose transferase-like glycosyltransferase
VILAVAAITVAGVIARWSLFGIGIWRDEAYTYFDITQATFAGMIQHITRVEANPPLFFVLERFAGSLFGFNEAALKSLSILCGIAVIPATYRLASALMRTRAALLAAWLVATTQSAIYYSQEMRPYALCVFLLVLTADSYVRWMARPERPWWVLWAVLLAYTQYVGVVALSGMLIGTLCLRPGTRPSFLQLAKAFALVAIAFVPWLPFLFVQLHAGAPWAYSADWPLRPVVAILLLSFTLPGSLLGRTHDLTLAGLTFVTIASYAVTLFARTRRQSKESADAGTLVLVVTLLWVAVVEAFLGYSHLRYMLPVLPLAIVIYSRILDDVLTRLTVRARLWAGLPAIVLACIGVLVAATSIRPVLAIAAQPKSGMRAAGEKLTEAPLQKAAILVAPDIASAVCAFYAPGRTVYGFARWNGSIDYDIAAEAAAWTAPDPVGTTLTKVALLRTQGTSRLAVVRPTGLTLKFSHAGTLPFELSDVLTDDLARRYPVVGRYDFPGSAERASIIVYDLRGDAKPRD